MKTKRSETSPGDERLRGYLRMLILTFGIIGVAVVASVFQSCSSDTDGAGRMEGVDPISSASNVIAHVQ